MRSRGGLSSRALGVAVGALGICVAAPASALPTLESCVSAVRVFSCDPVPDGAAQRRATLASLDMQARDGVAQHRLHDAARLFGCLLVADPRPEHASNLAVALKQSGDLPAALAAATCAEQLSVSASDALGRARARRLVIEQLLAALIPTPSPDDLKRAGTVSDVPNRMGEPDPDCCRSPLLAAASPIRIDEYFPRECPRRELPSGGMSSVCEPPAPLPARHLVAARTAVLIGAALVASGATAAYLIARARANDFQSEQLQHGFTGRAQTLRDQAQTWQAASIGGFVAAGLAGVTAAIVW